MSIHNLCFVQKYEKYQSFLSLKVDSQQAKQNWLNIYTYNEKKVYLNL